MVRWVRTIKRIAERRRKNKVSYWNWRNRNEMKPQDRRVRKLWWTSPYLKMKQHGYLRAASWVLLVADIMAIYENGPEETVFEFVLLMTMLSCCLFWGSPSRLNLDRKWVQVHNPTYLGRNTIQLAQYYLLVYDWIKEFISDDGRQAKKLSKVGLKSDYTKFSSFETLPRKNEPLRYS